jgi:hypothetical protein
MNQYHALKTRFTHEFIERCESHARHLFIHRLVLHSSTHLSVCQTCFQRIIFVCKMYEPMNEQNLHNFHY